ncbi:MAG: glycosyl hydrolase 108 family protein [Candidatus Sedimenticola sp. (ex Thyasira tokunagai)]
MSSTLKTAIINGIIEREGGYSNRRDDSGGETMYGITIAVARDYGYTGPMAELPIELARQILTDRYWHALQLDHIEALSPAITEELVDTGVNCGTGVAAKFLQRSLNALNQLGKLYPDIPTDGAIGPLTLAALRAYLQHRGGTGATVMHRMLNSLQGARYVRLAEKREKDEAFVYGWFRERVS